MTVHSDVSLIRPRSRLRLALGREANIGDLTFRRLTALFAGLVIVVLVWMAIQMGIAAKLSLAEFGLGFITSRNWDPVRDQYGALPFVYGTVVSSILALLISVPQGGSIDAVIGALVKAGASVRASGLVGSHATRYRVSAKGARPVPTGR